MFLLVHKFLRFFLNEFLQSEIIHVQFKLRPVQIITNVIAVADE